MEKELAGKEDPGTNPVALFTVGAPGVGKTEFLSRLAASSEGSIEKVRFLTAEALAQGEFTLPPRGEAALDHQFDDAVYITTAVYREKLAVHALNEKGVVAGEHYGPDKEKAEEKQTESFDKLLKNLQDAKPQVDESLPESKEAAPPTPSPEATLGTEMTMTEYDALSQQLARCWSIQAGARYAEDMVVKVRMTVSPDRRVLSAVIQDQWRYGQDSYFRAAADSAIRAVHSPQCETLQLPPDKYDQWKDMVVTFDPTEML